MEKIIEGTNGQGEFVSLTVSDAYFERYKEIENLYQSILDKIIKERNEGRESNQYKFSGCFLLQLFDSAVYKHNENHNQAYAYFKRLMNAPFYKDVYDDINIIGGFLFMKYDA